MLLYTLVNDISMKLNRFQPGLGIIQKQKINLRLLHILFSKIDNNMPKPVNLVITYVI
jgi:hypothetical protein